MKVNAGQAPSTLIPEYIGSDFDKVVTVADNMEAVTGVIDNLDHIKTIENNLGIINTVSSNIEDVVATGSNIETVKAVVADMGHIKTVESKLDDITTVADNITDVSNVSDNMDYVKDVAQGIEGLPVVSYIGDEPPTQPLNGAEWFCTKDGRTYTWYEDDDSGQWVESSPQSYVDTSNNFTLWKRSAAEAGLNLVDGSFEEGGVITSSTDVLLHRASGKIYSGPIGQVVAGTAPSSSGMFIDKSGSLLRNEFFRTPISFGATGDGLTSDHDAIVAYDAYCSATGVPFDGQGLTYAVRAPLLTSGRFYNVRFVPSLGHSGDGPTFQVNQSSGECLHENVVVTGFTNNGARISRGVFAGTPSFICRGKCDYSANGSLVRTQTLTAVDMQADYVIQISDSSKFSASNKIWIGDGKYEVLSVAAGVITLTNNGSQATLLSGGRNKWKAGQYVTIDGTGKNGITIGDGGAGWDLDISAGSLTANDCGWFGLFHWANSKAGTQNISKAKASGCGYIGIGLGHTNAGLIDGCITEYNGNNGIDTLSSTSAVRISSGVSRYNGVDGVYIGGSGTGEIARLERYDARFNRRIGFLYNSSVVAANYSASDVDCRDNDFRSLTLTGCGVGIMSRVSVGGATFGNSVFIEGKNGCAGNQSHTLSECSFATNIGGFPDIGGNFTDYTTSAFGALNIIDTYMIDGSQVTADTYGVSPTKAKCRPSSRVVLTTSADSVAAGGSIALNMTFSLPFDSTVGDLSTLLAKFTVYTSEAMTSQSSLTSVTRTAGVEITAGLAHWMCSGNFGTLSYNLSLSTAGSRYIVVDVDGYKIGKLLTWS